jgi:hypothetical protein
MDTGLLGERKENASKKAAEIWGKNRENRRFCSSEIVFWPVSGYRNIFRVLSWGDFCITFQDEENEL